MTKKKARKKEKAYLKAYKKFKKSGNNNKKLSFKQFKKTLGDLIVN